MKSSRLPATLALVLMMLTGCEKAPTTPEAPEPALPSVGHAAEAMMNSRAPFKAWHQGFNHGTEGWFDRSSAAPLSWCGNIQRVDRQDGNVPPSAGSGYALVEVGECVPAWAIFQPSGPYSPGAGYSTDSPSGGFIQELDLYLDPDWADRTGFTYVGSFALLDGGGLRYFFIPVVKAGGALTVDGFEVSRAGWYTFRHTFGSEAGQLTASFELDRRGQTLFEKALTTTAYTGEATSSFEAANVGSGYIWFESYPASFFGTDFFASPVLPIDEHRVRQGS